MLMNSVLVLIIVDLRMALVILDPTLILESKLTDASIMVLPFFGLVTTYKVATGGITGGSECSRSNRARVLFKTISLGAFAKLFQSVLFVFGDVSSFSLNREVDTLLII